MHVHAVDLQEFTCSCMQEPTEVKGIELLELELGLLPQVGMGTIPGSSERALYVLLVTEPPL